MKTFKELGLKHEIIQSLNDIEFVEPSPIQEQAIPFLLESNDDLIALAQTGTGKTAAFSLPIINQVHPGEKELSTIILCPTRELCLQITTDIKKFIKHSGHIAVTAVYGGERIDLQISALRRGVNIVVGTPGRVHDLIRRKILNLQNIKWLVLDEADEMLDMGFKDDLDAILSQTPKTRQTLLFSATMSKSVRLIAGRYMKNIKEISIGERNVGAENISHEYYVTQPRERFEALKRILDYLPGVYGILFCRTKHETQEVADKLKQAHYNAEAMHGDISQNLRTKIMDRFKSKKINLLVATDVAARGIDVSNLSHIINYNLPDQDEVYTHRSGRTGRAQKSGVSISIIGPRETCRIRKIESIVGKKFECKKIPTGEDICRKQIDYFLTEIEEMDISQKNEEPYFEELAERLKKISEKNLIKLFLTHKFDKMLEEYKNTRDLNVDASRLPEKFLGRVESGDNVDIKMNLGKRHGLNIRGLFSLINSARRLKGIEIGRINLLPEASVFSVDKKFAGDVIQSLNGINFRGRKISVSQGSEPDERPRNRDERPRNRGDFKNKTFIHKKRRFGR